MKDCFLTKTGFIILFLCISFFCYSQEGETGASPDVKMLSGSVSGKALNEMTSPDLFNGTLNINIPFYQFSYEDVNYGVSISYNTQGVKVDEVESVVGLHWSLNSGASIVRIVKDIPDEVRMDSDSLLYKIVVNSNGYNDTVSVSSNREMHLYGNLFSGLLVPNPHHNVYRDKEYDEFIVNLNNTYFKFYIDGSQNIFTIPQNNFKVSVLFDNQLVNGAISNFTSPNKRVLNFIITDNKGIKYFFEPDNIQEFNENYFEDWLKTDYFNNGSNFPDLSYTSSWRIKKIILSNGQEITYKYEAENVLNNYTYTPNVNYHVFEYIDQFRQQVGTVGMTTKRKMTDPHLLSQIDYPNGQTVQFVYHPTNQKKTPMGEGFLKNIHIVEQNNCRSYDFHIQEYNTRFFLDSISQTDCNGYTEPFYKFSYIKNKLITKPIYSQSTIDSSTYPPIITPFPSSYISGYDSIWVKVPPRLSIAQDYFGYFNKDSSKIDMIPYHKDIKNTNSGYYGSERKYQPIYAQAGLLDGIQNAYGMSENFYYGSHYFSSTPLRYLVDSDSTIFGKSEPSGVRIDSIVRIDKYQPNQREVTIFRYNNGQVFTPGGRFHYPRVVNSNGQWTAIGFQGQFLTTHHLIHNANQGYSNVKVENYLNNTYLGGIEYEFTNLADASSNNQARYYKPSVGKHFFEYPYTDKGFIKDWEIGLPLQISEYDANNNITKTTENKYNFSAIDTSAKSNLLSVKEIRVYSNFGLPESHTWPENDPRIFKDVYFPFRGKALLEKSITRKYYTNSQFVADTVWYAYDYKNNLKSITTQDSKGQKDKTIHIYNYDVDGPANTNYSNPGSTLYKMTNDGLEIIVAVEKWRLGPLVVPITNKLLSAYITQYKYQNEKLFKNGLYTTRILNPIPHADYTQSSNTNIPPYSQIIQAFETNTAPNNFEKTSFVTQLGENGNPLETQLFNQNLYKAMIWDSTSFKKLAEASNCQLSDIAYTSFEEETANSNFIITNSYIMESSDVISGAHKLYFSAYGVNGNPGAPGEIEGTQNLKPGTSYTLSLWYQTTQTTTPFIIKVGSQDIPFSNSNIVYEKNGWKNYQISFTPNQSGKIKIKNNNILIFLDEVRLYPTNVQMVSWTYVPLFGISSETAPNGRITYFEYDKMGRLTTVRDQDDNILSETKYHISR